MGVSGELPVQTKKQRNKQQQKQTNKQINKQTNNNKNQTKPKTVDGGESTDRFACIDILFDEPVGVGIGQFGGKGPVVGWVDCLGSSR